MNATTHPNTPGAGVGGTVDEVATSRGREVAVTEIVEGVVDVAVVSVVDELILIVKVVEVTVDASIQVVVVVVGTSLTLIPLT